MPHTVVYFCPSQHLAYLNFHSVLAQLLLYLLLLLVQLVDKPAQIIQLLLDLFLRANFVVFLPRIVVAMATFPGQRRHNILRVNLRKAEVIESPRNS